MSTEIIKELRDKTGVSFGEIKKALDKANGDKEKALEFLAERSAEMAAKKSDREIAAGAVASYVHATGTTGAMIILGCETDFVSKNDEFKTLAYEIAMHITAMAPMTIEGEDDTALLNQPFIKDPSVTVGERLKLAIQKFGENIVISKMERYSI